MEREGFPGRCPSIDLDFEECAEDFELVKEGPKEAGG